MSLKEYQRKRDFSKTKEPRSGRQKGLHPLFVVQKHWASHLHYDFRLEAFGVLKSWAVPKGPSLDPHVKSLAVEVEDHPVSYGDFEGHIPESEYGGGDVIVWDHGTWDPPESLKQNLAKGHLDFELHGEKLKGKWVLQRTRTSPSGKNQWLLIKKTDEEAKPEDEFNVLEERPESVMTSKGKSALKDSSRRKSVQISKFKKTKKDLPIVEPIVEEDTSDEAAGKLVPKLALLVDKVPQGPQWIYETKYDGYRTFALIDRRQVQLMTRNNQDWTEKYGPLAKDISGVKAKQAVLDGEIVCLNAQGHSDFQALQTALKNGDYDNMVYYVFDLLLLDGKDLRARPLKERKKLLEDLLKKSKIKNIIYSKHQSSKGEALYAESCSSQLEGIVAKDKTAPYIGGRQPDWLKIKCSRRQEFVIGGYTDPQGQRSDFGALLMGTFEDGKLRYAGKVGTGFNHETLQSTLEILQKLEIDETPFELKSPRDRGIHWVQPTTVAEVEFRAMTADGLIRQGSFQGLRMDKKSSDVHFEKPLPAKKVKELKTEVQKKAKASSSKSRTGSTEIEGVQITHPDRILYPEAEISKLDVIRYYQAVEKWMLPYLANRPLSLLRCTGTQDQCFFQKHLQSNQMSGVNEIEFTYKDKHEKVIYVENSLGIIELAQWGSLEFHVWGSKAPDVLKPNLIVFDLDPDIKVPWKKVRDTAFEIRDNLEKLDLVSFVKVTGGKGLHVHVPLNGNYNWDQIKNFAKTFVSEFEERKPDLYLTKATKSDREGKIFLDYLRNGFGATSVAPYSLRAKGSPTVAMPISWDELKTLKRPDSFLINEVPKILKERKQDPWKGYFDLRQKIKILE